MGEEGTGKSQLIELPWLPDREGIERNWEKMKISKSMESDA